MSVFVPVVRESLEDDFEKEEQHQALLIRADQAVLETHTHTLSLSLSVLICPYLPRDLKTLAAHPGAVVVQELATGSP